MVSMPVGVPSAGLYWPGGLPVVSLLGPGGEAYPCVGGQRGAEGREERETIALLSVYYKYKYPICIL